MIRQIERKHLGECAAVIRASFLTVAQTLHFTQQNAPRFIAFTMTEEEPTTSFRMNFSTPSDESIVKGVEILGKLIKERF